MKKCTILIYLLLFPSIIFCQELYFKTGVDIPGKLKLNSKIKDVEFTTIDDIETHLFYGLHFEIEYLHYLFEKIGAGGGFCYESELRSNSDDLETFGFNTMPIYFILKYDFLCRNYFKVSFLNRLGYSAVGITSDKMEEFENQSGDFYYGFGFAVKDLKSQRFYLEIFYSVSQANFSKTGGAKSIEHIYKYPKYSLTIGKVLNFSRDKK